MSSRVVRIAAAHGTTITPRGGGTSQAGQAIGAGLVLDTSKYLNRILEVNAQERWARVEPGVVLDDLNAQLRPHGLRFAPDLSSASRATVGGMMANNSSGARSVVYGKTIDHVLEQHVVLADGARRASSARSQRRELDRGLARARASRPTCYRVVPRMAAQPRRRDRAPVSRRCCAGSAATTSMRSSTPDRPVNLTKIMVGSEGTLGIVVEAQDSRWCRCPRLASCWPSNSRTCSMRWRRRRWCSRHGPSAVEVMDALHPRPHARERGARCLAPSDSDRPRRRRCCASSSPASRPTSFCRGSRRSSATCAVSGFRCRRRARSIPRRRRGSGVCAKPRWASRWR